MKKYRTFCFGFTGKPYNEQLFFAQLCALFEEFISFEAGSTIKIEFDIEEHKVSDFGDR